MTDPIQISGDLFEAVQNAHIFPDGKSFVDHTPTADPTDILARFRTQRDTAGFDLKQFVTTHFTLAPNTMRDHIRQMWPQLYRTASTAAPHSSLIPLPHPYIVPGGRFREIYYWDSYFSALGLVADGHIDWVHSLIDNFAHLISVYGHIPNGSRIYYLSRSQPPFFCLLLQLLEQEKGTEAIHPYLVHLKAEYDYWMIGQHSEEKAAAHTVKTGTGDTLNRYWDAQDIPRPEAHAQDRETVGTGASNSPTYRHLRAGAESGWDFSSRWMSPDDIRLATIRTTDILPIDLNCLLFNMETQLGRWLSPFAGSEASRYTAAAEKRRQAIQALFWDDKTGFFYDVNWREDTQTGMKTIAAAYPLYFGLASPEQAARVAQNIEAEFLQPGGVVTTLFETGEQWDAPNGWAPLQWMAIQALCRTGHDQLGREIAQRFVQLADKVYHRTGKMMEKYDVCDLSKGAGGGEYPNQDGFGWTNGVIAALSDQFDL